jgi:hypothetical protein
MTPPTAAPTMVPTGVEEEVSGRMAAEQPERPSEEVIEEETVELRFAESVTNTAGA